jgi:hypothetical protein
MQTTETVDFPLAMHAFLQTALLALGLFFVFRMIYAKNKMCGKLSFAGGLLVTFGGLLKTLQLFSLAASGEDKPNYGNSLLVFLSAGFICIAFALWRSGRRDEAMKLSHVWTIPLVLIAFAWAFAGYTGFFTHSLIWFYVLLAVTITANAAMVLQLLYRSLKPSPVWLGVGLFILNLVIISAYFKNLRQGVNVQEFSQTLLTFGQGSFAVASRLLLKRIM